jgi:uncharacterized protein (TIGR02996 family)
MTTEDDFQRALAAEPSDWHTRLVFADWLQERGDPRAEGYRAMGLLRRAPALWGGRGPWVWLNSRWAKNYDPTDDIRTATVPDDWYEHMPKNENDVAHERTALNQALDDAAAGFARLPAARRAELLTPN